MTPGRCGASCASAACTAGGGDSSPCDGAPPAARATSARATNRASERMRDVELLWQYDAMPVIEGIDVEPVGGKSGGKSGGESGSAPNLVILHSLLADRSAFDRAAPLLGRS